MEVLTGHYLMNGNGPLDIIKSPVAHKHTPSPSPSPSPSQTLTVAAMHTQWDVRHRLSRSALWQPHKNCSGVVRAWRRWTAL